MADIPTSSTENLSSPEKDCRKRKHFEQSDKENKRQTLSVNIKETSVSPLPNGQPLDTSNVNYVDVRDIPDLIQERNIRQPETLGLGHCQTTNIVHFPTFATRYLPCPPWYILGNLFQTPGISEIGNQNYSTFQDIKEIITLPSCVLYPPGPNERFKFREKPPGCRTVWVGGMGKEKLPDKVTQDVVREIFNSRNKVVAIRMNRKGFCHVQFSCESEVDEALKLAGYQIRVENKNEESYVVRIHVDYAASNEDQKCLEKAVRAVERKARHEILKQIDETPVIPSFSKIEYRKLRKLFNIAFTKEEGKEIEIKSSVLQEGVHTFIAWLKRGEVNRNNTGLFIDIIQLLYQNIKKAHVGYKDKYYLVQSVHEKSINNIKSACRELEEVMTLARHQNSLQTKSFISCFNQFKNIVALIMDQDKDLHDDVDSASIANVEEINVLRGEVIEAEKDISSLKEGIERSKEEQAKLDQHIKAKLLELDTLKKEYSDLKSKLDLFKSTQKQQTSTYTDRSKLDTDKMTGNNRKIESIKYLDMKEFYEEARLLSQLFEYLSIHPFYVEIDTISSYLSKFVGSVSPSYITRLMRRYPSVFQEEVTMVGASMEKWMIRKVSK